MHTQTKNSLLLIFPMKQLLKPWARICDAVYRMMSLCVIKPTHVVWRLVTVTDLMWSFCQILSFCSCENQHGRYSPYRVLPTRQMLSVYAGVLPSLSGDTLMHNYTPTIVQHCTSDIVCKCVFFLASSNSKILETGGHLKIGYLLPLTWYTGK